MIALATQTALYDKMMSNIEEVKARGARVLGFALEGDEELHHLADEVLYLPRTLPLFTPVLSVIPCSFWPITPVSPGDMTWISRATWQRALRWNNGQEEKPRSNVVKPQNIYTCKNTRLMRRADACILQASACLISVEAAPRCKNEYTFELGFEPAQYLGYDGVGEASVFKWEKKLSIGALSSNCLFLTCWI